MVAPKLAFRRQHTGDRALDEMQRLAQDASKRINSLPPFSSGKLISVHFATPGSFLAVVHGLGVPAACIVIRMNYDPAASGPTFSENPTQADLNHQLSIACSVVSTVDLWFYPRSSVAIPSGATQSSP